MPDNDKDNCVSCSILGENFNLRCSPEKKPILEASVKNLQSKISKMLRDNPSISPFQAAILTALDSESNLLEFLESDTPFINQATKKILKMKAELKKTENGRVQRK
jgi:cell division protein ZapA (FtsZ GTPase activity inhibitor)